MKKLILPIFALAMIQGTPTFAQGPTFIGGQGYIPFGAPIRSTYINNAPGRKMLDVRDLDGAYVKSAAMSGTSLVITFQVAANTEESLTFTPAAGGMDDGVLTSAAFEKTSGELTLRTSTGGAITVDLSDLATTDEVNIAITQRLADYTLASQIEPFAKTFTPSALVPISRLPSGVALDTELPSPLTSAQVRSNTSTVQGTISGQRVAQGVEANVPSLAEVNMQARSGAPYTLQGRVSAENVRQFMDYQGIAHPGSSGLRAAEAVDVGRPALDRAGNIRVGRAHTGQTSMLQVTTVAYSTVGCTVNPIPYRGAHRDATQILNPVDGDMYWNTQSHHWYTYDPQAGWVVSAGPSAWVGWNHSRADAIARVTATQQLLWWDGQNNVQCVTAYTPSNTPISYEWEAQPEIETLKDRAANPLGYLSTYSASAQGDDALGFYDTSAGTSHQLPFNVAQFIIRPRYQSNNGNDITSLRDYVRFDAPLRATPHGSAAGILVDVPDGAIARAKLDADVQASLGRPGLVPLTYGVAQAATEYDDLGTFWAGNIYQANVDLVMHAARGRIETGIAALEYRLYYSPISRESSTDYRSDQSDRIQLHINGSTAAHQVAANTQEELEGTVQSGGINIAAGSYFMVAINANANPRSLTTSGSAEDSHIGFHDFAGDQINYVAKIQTLQTPTASTNIYHNDTFSDWAQIDYTVQGAGQMVLEDEGVVAYLGAPRINCVGGAIECSNESGVATITSGSGAITRDDVPTQAILAPDAITIDALHRWNGNIIQIDETHTVTSISMLVHPQVEDEYDLYIARLTRNGADDYTLTGTAETFGSQQQVTQVLAAEFLRFNEAAGVSFTAGEYVWIGLRSAGQSTARLVYDAGGLTDEVDYFNRYTALGWSKFTGTGFQTSNVFHANPGDSAYYLSMRSTTDMSGGLLVADEGFGTYQGEPFINCEGDGIECVRGATNTLDIRVTGGTGGGGSGLTRVAVDAPISGDGTLGDPVLIADDAIELRYLSPDVQSELTRNLAPTGVVYGINQSATNRDPASYHWIGNIYQAVRDQTIRGFQSYINGENLNRDRRWEGFGFKLTRHSSSDYRAVGAQTAWDIHRPGHGWGSNVTHNIQNLDSSLETRGTLHLEEGDYYFLGFLVSDPGFSPNPAVTTYLVEASGADEEDHIHHADFPHDYINYVAYGRNNSQGDRFVNGQNFYHNATNALRMLVFYDVVDPIGDQLDLANIPESILPDADNMHGVGSSARTFNFGHFTNFVIDDTLNVGGDVSSDLVPDADGNGDVGTAARTWGGMRAVNVIADQNLQLGSQDMGDAYVGSGITGQVIEFTQADGTTETITVPAGSGGSTDLENVTTDILPSADTSRNVGTTARTFASGHFNAMTVDSLLTLGTRSLGDAYVQSSITGQEITFTQADGSTNTITVPAGGITQSEGDQRYFQRTGGAITGETTVTRSSSGEVLTINGTNAGNSTIMQIRTPSTGSQKGFGIQRNGETFDFVQFAGDITNNDEPGIAIGTGSASRDINLYRGGADLLETDDAFRADTLAVSGTLATTQTNLGIVTSFTGLSDTPSTITADDCVKGNAAGDALEFGTCAPGGGGDITGVTAGVGLTGGGSSGGVTLDIDTSEADFPVIPLAKGGTGAATLALAQQALSVNDACTDLTVSGQNLRCTQADGGTDDLNMRGIYDGMRDVLTNSATPTLADRVFYSDESATGDPLVHGNFNDVRTLMTTTWAQPGAVSLVPEGRIDADMARDSELDDLFKGAVISGNNITFTQNDDSTVVVTVPSSGGGSGITQTDADARYLQLDAGDGNLQTVASPVSLTEGIMVSSDVMPAGMTAELRVTKSDNDTAPVMTLMHAGDDITVDNIQREKGLQIQRTGDNRAWASFEYRLLRGNSAPVIDFPEAPNAINNYGRPGLALGPGGSGGAGNRDTYLYREGNNHLRTHGIMSAAEFQLTNGDNVGPFDLWEDVGADNSGMVGQDRILIGDSGLTGNPNRYLIAQDVRTYMHAGLSAAVIPDLGADKITSGEFDPDRIPNLSAAKITSGTFPTARIANEAVTESKLDIDNAGSLGNVLHHTGTGLAWADANIAIARNNSVVVSAASRVDYSSEFTVTSSGGGAEADIAIASSIARDSEIPSVAAGAGLAVNESGGVYTVSVNEGFIADLATITNSLPLASDLLVFEDVSLGVLRKGTVNQLFASVVNGAHGLIMRLDPNDRAFISLDITDLDEDSLADDDEFVFEDTSEANDHNPNKISADDLRTYVRGTNLNLLCSTQAAYDALATPDASTVYVIAASCP